MNTLSDTDEGRARPSVWPVYVMSVVFGFEGFLLTAIGLITLWVLQRHGEFSWAWAQSLGMSGKTMARGLACLVGVFGLLCMVAAVNASKLRPWAWWFIAVVVAVKLVGSFAALAGDYAEYSLGDIVIGGCMFFVLCWPLVTRRRLFFPRA